MDLDYFGHATYALINEINISIIEIQSTLVISNFTGLDKIVRVIRSSRQPNCDVIGMMTVRLCSPKTCMEGTCIWQFK